MNLPGRENRPPDPLAWRDAGPSGGRKSRVPCARPRTFRTGKWALRAGIPTVLRKAACLSRVRRPVRRSVLDVGQRRPSVGLRDRRRFPFRPRGCGAADRHRCGRTASPVFRSGRRSRARANRIALIPCATAFRSRPRGSERTLNTWGDRQEELSAPRRRLVVQAAIDGGTPRRTFRPAGRHPPAASRLRSKAGHRSRRTAAAVTRNSPRC